MKCGTARTRTRVEDVHCECELIELGYLFVGQVPDEHAYYASNGSHIVKIADEGNHFCHYIERRQ